MALAERHIPDAFNIPMEVGLRWLPCWSSSPVRDGSPGVSGDYGSPFHRMIWERFSVSLWDKAWLLGANALDKRSSESRLWPFKPENPNWSTHYFCPLFVYFFFPRTIYPCKGEYDPDFNNFPLGI